MNETLIVAIISAGLSALINCVFQLANKIIDNKKECQQNKLSELASYKEKKEKVYIAAIGRLLQIRRGFDYTHEMFVNSVTINESIKKSNDEFAEISPQLRLYAPRSVFNEYYELAKFSRFAYAPSNGPRLIENSKTAFEIRITILAQLMQEDLGYRKLNSEYEPFNCPKCKKEHDLFSKCPSCGMTFDELKIKLRESSNQVVDSGENQEDNF